MSCSYPMNSAEGLSESPSLLPVVLGRLEERTYVCPAPNVPAADVQREESSERAPLVAQKIDSLAKLLFNKSIIGGKGSPSEPPASPKIGERTMEVSAAVAICTEYLRLTSRYELITPLNAVGSRPNKHWFAVHDNSIKTDRLLTLMPLTSACPLEPGERSRCLSMELFRALHHPYIYPVLDLDLRAGHAIVVLPYNVHGSLKDLLYKLLDLIPDADFRHHSARLKYHQHHFDGWHSITSTWSEEYHRKYCGSGGGLPAWQVARFGRQILEGLLFLKEKGFPPFRHLHSGNVMIQNGVARICGLENTLVGASSRFLMSTREPEPLALGYVLYEMCACTDLNVASIPACFAPLQPTYTHVTYQNFIYKSA
ncbi:Slowpoke-binding protein [Eumeta japonica]|uniref:Slowpoke-binding protein n=1 Tax=Eumeta variegata TaxID=151549 RepID=A0A4C1WEH9_EUMVA|nr:Slowpoke-binding protein [Eumeta japonica]